MTKASNRQIGSDWLAAVITQNRLQFWIMCEDRVKETHETGLEDLSVSALDAILAKHKGTRGLPLLLAGLADAPAAPVPAKPEDLIPKHQRRSERDLFLLPGLVQSTPPAEIQGEAYQIAGFNRLNPRWDGVLCLPGAASHWVLSSAAEAVSIQSFLTGEIWQSQVLKLPYETAQIQASTWSRGALCSALADIMAKPERLAARLAELRLAAKRDNMAAAEAKGLLWGYLIGAELAAARPYWLGQNLALIGPDALTAPYAAACADQGLPVTLCDPKAMALAGLTQAWRKLQTPAPQ